MSCRRVRRELVELFRFGGLDVRSGPHLEHLAECRACRDEVGIDRVLVQQLRVALAERAADAAPPAAAWPTILARAQAPERGVRAWLRSHAIALAARLRMGTTAAAMTLAVIIAVGTEVGVRQPDPLGPAPSDRLAEAFEAGPARPTAASVRTVTPAEEAAAVGRGARRSAGPELSVRGESLYEEAVEPALEPAPAEPELYFTVRPGVPARGTDADADPDAQEAPDAAAQAPATGTLAGSPRVGHAR